MDWREGWDQDKLIRFGASRNLEWIFVMSNSQHQNRVTEVMVKQVKGVQKSLVRALGDTKFTLDEMFTLLAEIGNLLNERPIGIKVNNVSSLDYLSPNALLLGRSSDRIASDLFNNLYKEYGLRRY